MELWLEGKMLKRDYKRYFNIVLLINNRLVKSHADNLEWKVSTKM